MVADLIDDKSIIRDKSEGNRIYNKGCFGEFKDHFCLDLIESCYLLEKNRIVIKKNGKKINLKKFITHAMSFMPDFEIKYLVYRDMRERGYVVRTNDDFLVYSRGKKPPSKAAFTLKTISERYPFSIKDIMMFISKTKLKLLLGIVDEEGDVTYYLAKFFDLSGEMDEMTFEGKIVLINDRSITWDEQLIQKLRDSHIGKDFGSYVQLSLTETAYLLDAGAKVIKNKRLTSKKRFIEHAQKIQPDIADRLTAFISLRKLQLLPKTGFKFGSHFRVYREDPEISHAPYLVHVVKKSYKATWAEVSRAVRLAHSVKKEMLFCIINRDEVNYLRLKRITP